jgi:hypothetical protein
MRNRPALPEDVAGPAGAVSKAIAGENLQRAAALLTACTERFTARARTPDEFQHYIQWLREQKAAVTSVREHAALRLSAINATQYGRAGSQATWSIDA